MIYHRTPPSGPAGIIRVIGDASTYGNAPNHYKTNHIVLKTGCSCMGIKRRVQNAPNDSEECSRTHTSPQASRLAPTSCPLFLQYHTPNYTQNDISTSARLPSFPSLLSTPRLVQAIINNQRAGLPKALKQIPKLLLRRGGKRRIHKHKQRLVLPQLEQATQHGE